MNVSDPRSNGNIFSRSCDTMRLRRSLFSISFPSHNQQPEYNQPSARQWVANFKGSPSSFQTQQTSRLGHMQRAIYHYDIAQTAIEKLIDNILIHRILSIVPVLIDNHSSIHLQYSRQSHLPCPIPPIQLTMNAFMGRLILCPCWS